MLIYLMPLGIFYAHLGHFMTIWYLYDHLVHFVFNWYIFPVLVLCIKKNLATLNGRVRWIVGDERLEAVGPN
jgi:hypothetical protein